MKTKSVSFKIIGTITVIAFSLLACQETHELPPVPSGVQGYSLLGDTLRTPEIDSQTYDEQNTNLLQAVMDYRVDPEDPEVIIWLGRRTAYLGEYREAVRIFTEGIFKHPEDPRMYRHRGHRYLTLRMFDMAIRDLENAESLMRNREDQVEPDGLPNPAGIPTSTLKSNVWYHMGLAYYAKGDFQNAADAYEKALELELTDDMRIATLYWYYMALKRMGKDTEAGRAIADIQPDIELLENDVYLNLILVFNGVFDTNRLLESGEDALQNATLGYGIGNWHYINGREERAVEIWQLVYDSGQWPSFGFIAAEAELARLQ
ncbi:MAG: tetratricopeptide repeat protein [Balneolaceae bacterium]|nr:tetratricopeptide repeat protein [Balneolaceae bacterium]